MLEDKLLIWKLKHGNRDALCRIYEKYRDYLLKLATALLHDVNVAEDIVHDVFLNFAQSGDKIKLSGSLKGYLRTCVVNSTRNKIRAKRLRTTIGLDEVETIAADSNKADYWIICKEESKRISNALAQIPFEQREVVVLHLHGEMKFIEIAKLQEASIKTIQSRYRYGLDKLQSLLNSEVEK
ncbi:MAG: RNA polymerase sigma factor [Anaerohalosphaera sp.]|nr:RNA polymerase sigma factor [Anaerohalosphaera sp.]